MDGLHVSENGDGVAPRGYLAMKALAKAQGCRIADVLALAEKNDPFFAGTPATSRKRGGLPLCGGRVASRV